MPLIIFRDNVRKHHMVYLRELFYFRFSQTSKTPNLYVYLLRHHVTPVTIASSMNKPHHYTVSSCFALTYPLE